MRRALPSTDHRDRLRAERDVVARLAESGIDVASTTPAGDALTATVVARVDEGEARVVTDLDDTAARQLADLLRSIDPEVADVR